MAGGMRSAATDAFWRDYRKAAGLHHDDYDVVAFGDGAAMATELAELTVAGIKRATAGLVRQFGPVGEPPPVAGGYVVLLDGADLPRAIWRTTELRIGPLNSVDERFARDEGEGERTRDWWLAAHRRFFGRRAAAEGFAMHDEIETVFERFEVVWPPEIADTGKPGGKIGK
ncbi:ASCH domain-containing protein [Bradyrhizobium sp.]|uniref:ASCH domain-containing protein n=1 Tax=Bradyrhizobium sp. TaxID=376 RepID=UPI0025BD44F2|nr:ASCH domain-containing protein [Bradyrhizobium sp.]